MSYYDPGNNLSGVAVQFATQFGANATQKYLGVAVFRMENGSLAHASMPNCYTIFQKQIIPCDPMLFEGWPAVSDVGPALKQHWVNVSCLLSLIVGLIRQR